MSFAQPLVLLFILPAIAVFWLIARRSNAPIARDQVWQSLILRCFAVSLVIIAAAGPALRRDTQDQSIMFLVDVSRSISPAARAREFDLVKSAMAAKPSRDSAGVVTFASDASVDQTPSKQPVPLSDHVSVDDESTDIGAAIRTAGAVLPASGPRQIVVLSDGNQTTGDAAREASATGVPVNAVDPSQFLGTVSPEASVARVDLPPTVHDGEPLVVRSVVASSVAQTGTLTVKSGGQTLKIESVALTVGKNLVTVPITLRGAGLRQVEVDIDAPQDTLLENNRGVAMTQVIGKPRILYLTDQPGKVSPTLQKAMAVQSITIDLRKPTDAPSDIAGLSAYDGVVLSDVPASELTVDQQNALQSSVRDFGLGLGMVGGTNSYISGGWAETPVEQALPVLMKPREGEKMPAADIVVVLDASSSMSREEGGVQKVQLAARAAVSLMGALQPSDRVAVITVTTVPTLAMPFCSPKQALEAKKDIEGVEANGGGIYCLTGLQAAYDLLDSSKAPIKHVIICPDTDDSEEQDNCVQLARTLRLSEHVTTSVCGIGEWQDRDVGFQRQLADAGGGQLFIVSQASDLPQFFQRDLSHFQAPPYVEGLFRPRVDTADKVLAGLSVSAEPPLLGYNVVTAKPGATVAMRAPSNPDPILAYRAYGLGHTFAFTSDETDHWARPWLKWGGYEQFWGQLLRWSLRNNRPASFQSFAEIGMAGQAHVVVDAFAPGGGYLNGASFAASVATPGNQTRRLALEQTAPGRYEGQFPASEVGAYLITVAKNDGSGEQATLGVAQPYPAEYAAVGPDLPLLQQIADVSGGRMLSSPADVWKTRPGALQTAMVLAPLALLIGVALFVLDIAWRRLGLRVRPQRIAAPAITAVTSAAQAGTAAMASARETRLQSANASKARREQMQHGVVDEGAVLSRTVGRRIAAIADENSDDDSFPLVASLDDLRRKERARERANIDRQ